MKNLKVWWQLTLMTTPSIADFRYRSTTQASEFSVNSLAVVMHFSTPTGIGRIVLPETCPCTLNDWDWSLLPKRWRFSVIHLINCAFQAVSVLQNILSYHLRPTDMIFSIRKKGNEYFIHQARKLVNWASSEISHNKPWRTKITWNLNRLSLSKIYTWNTKVIIVLISARQTRPTTSWLKD